VKSEVRPTFILNNIENLVHENLNLQISSNLITLPYTHAVYANQGFASTTRNCAGLFYSYKGELTLNPSVDNWISTDISPSLQITQDLGLSNWQNMAQLWGTEWDDWQTRWTSSSSSSSSSTSVSSDASGTSITNSTTTTTVTNTGQERLGTQLEVTSTTNVQNYGERIIDVSVIPYMRSIPVKFSAIGLSQTQDSMRSSIPRM